MNKLPNILILLIVAGCVVSCNSIGIAAEGDTTQPVNSDDYHLAEPSLIHIDLDRLNIDTTYIHLLKSSVFLNPRSIESAQLYLEDFNEHDAARLYGAFEYVLMQSADLKSFKAGLQKRRDYLDTMSKVHDKFIITITLMPQWLSNSSDSHSIEGYWRNFHTHSPKDYERWREVVMSAAEFFSQFESVQRYYEIWNEPDTSYWQEGIDQYLELYAHTSRAVKEADPSGKVGGASVNGWNGKIQKSPDREMVNIELIRYAGRHDLPLDFISWHHFGSFAGRLVSQAKQRYEQECRLANYSRIPEFIVSEWNNISHYRGKEESAALMADTMFDLYQAQVSIQTIAAWEDFVPRENLEGYGLITQKLDKKTIYHVHRFFHELAMTSDGIAVIELPMGHRREGTRRVIVSKQNDNSLKMMAWATGYSAAGSAAIDSLLQHGVPQQAILKYNSMIDLENALRDGITSMPEYDEQFMKAAQVYRQHDGRDSQVAFQIDELSDVNVIEARSVKSSISDKPVSVEGNRILCDLDKFEVLYLHVQLKNDEGSE